MQGYHSQQALIAVEQVKFWGILLLRATFYFLNLCMLYVSIVHGQWDGTLFYELLGRHGLRQGHFVMEVELEYSWAHIDVPDPEHSDQTENNTKIVS